MNIFNMIFGSFFRTLGRLLCYLLIGFLIALIMFKNDVFALTNTDPFGYIIPDTANFWNVTSTGNVSLGYEYIYNEQYNFYVAHAKETWSAYYNSYGGTITICDLGLIKDVYYSMTVNWRTANNYYIHPFYSNQNNKLGITNSPNTFNLSFSFEDISTDIQQLPFPYLENYNISTYTFVFKAPSNGTCLNHSFSTNQTGNSANMNLYQFLGYSISNMGQSVDTTTINNAINQGFADVQTNLEIYSTRIQNSINNLDEDINEVNNTLIDTNDYLKDDSPPSSDISSLGNVQGLLPPGPVDSLLNIPFMFLSVITSSFGGVCKPISGTFVFDSTLEIPCFSELFYNNVPELVMNFINLIPSAFILITYFKHLYKKVDRAVSMNTNADDEWGVI